MKVFLAMKALILSAGLGTRLRPLTNNKPKVMITVGGKPILWYHIQLLKKYGIKDIWINLHYFPEVIKKYFGNGSKFGIKISYSFEKELLGTSGALKNPGSGIEKALRDGTFIVAYGDILPNFNYKRLLDFHRKRRSVWTEGTHPSAEPWTKGVIETNKDGRITKFVEKGPKKELTSNQVRAGIIILEPKVLDYIPNGFSDFGLDVAPKALKLGLPMYAIDTKSYSKDIGTLKRLKKARADFKAGKLSI
jgi:NDP-sugar pyrophosphorylase family protein